MDKYYYLVSQLPTLFFDKESPFTIEWFLEECKKWLSAKDYKKLIDIDLRDTQLNKKDSRLRRNYKLFEYHFRCDLASWRESVRKGEDFKPKNFPAELVREGNPLEIEKNLLRYRWNYLNGLEQDHHFDFDLLIIYYLRLQLLQNLNRFDKEKGMEKFKEFSNPEIQISRTEDMIQPENQ